MNLPQKPRWIVFLIATGIGTLICVIGLSRLVQERQLPPTARLEFPIPHEVGVAPGAQLILAFNKKMMPESVDPSTFVLRDDKNQPVAANVLYQEATHSAILTPRATLPSGTTYRVEVLGGANGIKDQFGNSLLQDDEWTFSTGVPPASSPLVGPGGPILVVTSAANGFSQYYAEILRNEGYNEFSLTDTSGLDAEALRDHDLILLGEVSLNPKQIAVVADWVRNGGNLITMRPGVELLKAITKEPEEASQGEPYLDGGYLAVDATHRAGAGLVKLPLQFHGPADLKLLDGEISLAKLYKDADTPTPYSAVSLLKAGRGNVVVFSYDLARSVVYTRQGNPDWSGEERDQVSPIRSDDLFYGASPTDPKRDWVDRDRLPIPQADEQQRFLGNIITLINAEKKPLPHFWYLPRGLKAAIVMTGDDHGHGGTVKRFEHYLQRSPAGCSLENWECIRGTSNVFVGSISAADASTLVSEGFEIGLHVYTGCKDWPVDNTPAPDGKVEPHVDRAFADTLYDRQLAAFAIKYPGIPAPVSNRTDCVTWGDYDTQPQVELGHGIRFDTNYYYWPSKWVQNRPALFTGSGMPMRFARRDGTMIDVYQAATQMTDESQQAYPFTVDALLSNALGNSQYFGVFTVNMHTDRPKSVQADAVIASALAHHIPVVTAVQMLNWIDGRNASSFQNVTWNGEELDFNIVVGVGGNGIQALLPIQCGAGSLAALSLDGVEINYRKRTIAGLDYAAFSAAPGTFRASYRPAPANPS